MSEIKLCKDCENYGFIEPNIIAGWGDKCLRKELSFVDGRMFPIFISCAIERGRENGCGKDAKYFEPKGE